jgi:hypothetical protein
VASFMMLLSDSILPPFKTNPDYHTNNIFRFIYRII